MGRHAVLTDPELHEVKGASTATLGHVYTANGDGTAAFAAPAGATSGTVVKRSTTTSNTTLTGTTLIPFDNTIPQLTEGTNVFSAAFTATTTSNMIEIDATIYGSYSVAAKVTAALFVDSTANALAATAVQTTTTDQTFVLRLKWKFAVADTSAHTYKIQVGGSTAGTFTLNGNAGAAVFGGVAASVITITEVKA